MPPLSRRVPHAATQNTLTARLEQLRASGVAIANLTESNPTRAGIQYPPGLLAALASDDALRYDPAPFGLESARRAVAADHARRGADVRADQVVLTASTSEAYSWLFKAFCNPGERILVPRPSYPLFEHLAALEGVGIDTYDLHYHGRWDVDTEAIRTAADTVRAVVVVTPNNPTGSCVSRQEAAVLAGICSERGWALVADEVFADYLLDPGDAAIDLAATSPPCLTISLGGLSKSVGLPQVKLGWIVIGGPDAATRQARAALEIVADSYLSVSTPAQVAVPSLLEGGAVVREAIRGRIAANLSILQTAATNFDQIDVLRTEGGWSAVIRVPATRSEEALVLELLDRERILVHPGFFFDFRHEAFLVVSLLGSPEVLGESLPRMFRLATA